MRLVSETLLTPCCLQVTISGAAKVATTKQEFAELKAAQAKSDIREKFAGGLGEVDPEVGLVFPSERLDFHPLRNHIGLFVCWANSVFFFIYISEDSVGFCCHPLEVCWV